MCLDTYPPIFYLNDTSRYIINLITQYNQYKGCVTVAYTFDAGPNAVLLAKSENIPEILSLIQYYLPSSSNTRYDQLVIIIIMISFLSLIHDVQWNLSIVDTVGTDQSVLIIEVSSFQRYSFVHYSYFWDSIM